MMRYVEKLYGDYAQTFEVTRVLYHEKTDLQDLVIFETPGFGRVMALDGIVQVTTKDEYVYHEMMTHVPILARGDVRDVLIIGGGDGGILREVLRHKQVERATLVEIDRSVVDLCRVHMPEISAGAFEDARANLIIADGVKFVAETSARFDVIIVDSTDPIGPGEVLFTEKFYADCRRCLKAGGVMVTQNGVPFFQGAELTTTYRRMGRVFQETRFYTAVVPSYVGGFMTLGWGTDDVNLHLVPVETLRERYQNANLTTRYYTSELHQAAFALPRFVQDLML